MQSLLLEGRLLLNKSLVPGFGFADYSSSYRVYKKHTLKALHQFTKVRREELQQVVHNAVEILLKEFKLVKSQPLDADTVLTKAVLLSWDCVCYGEFFDADSEMVKKRLSQKEISRYIVFGSDMSDFLPWAKFLLRKQLRNLSNVLKMETSTLMMLQLADIALMER